MLILQRTDSQHPALKELIPLLDRYLAEMNGEAQTFYGQFNSLAVIPHFVVAQQEGHPVGCGAMKEIELGTVEIKRMFVLSEARGLRIGSQILTELETWALELGYRRTVLETGKIQSEAVRLYERSGYQVIPNYGQYAGVETSVCFQKALD